MTRVPPSQRTREAIAALLADGLTGETDVASVFSSKARGGLNVAIIEPKIFAYDLALHRVGTRPIVRS